ncbi:ABC transporter permease [Halotalea alkalilenta]|uniref:ABC transporter permease n=1 Tax=Halotalea alkalilenta TaxID=376489 RepID=UPI000489AB5C|nr:ABC transporter permease [Halotalea alkalilenta]
MREPERGALIWAPVTILVLLLAWQLLVMLLRPPAYLLPDPLSVFETLIARISLIAPHAWVTLVEMLLGLAVGVSGGVLTALALASSALLRRPLLPLLIASQAVPLFALAPLMMLWFGYGMTPKVLMAALIIYFPVASTCYDGLRQTERGWLDLALIMRASPLRIMLLVRLPAALPSFCSGLRLAAICAPIGAVIGEWAGASAGLGYLMIQANAQMQTALMFAALLVLIVFALLLYAATELVARWLLPWRAVSHR